MSGKLAMTGVDQRRAVVTGAASGIGAAVARRLLRERVAVLAVDLNEAGLAGVAEMGATPLVVDLTEPEQRQAVIEAGVGADYLVNAAGLIRLKPILQITLQDIRDVYAVNVEALWFLSAGIGQTMPSGAAIVNLSSSSAKLATTIEAAAYASSKAAVLSITRSFAYAFAERQVRVNAVCPGIVDTPMQDRVVEAMARERQLSIEQVTEARLASVPLRRASSADECAGLIWFLLSGESAYMTGQAIDFSGGLVMW